MIYTETISERGAYSATLRKQRIETARQLATKMAPCPSPEIINVISFHLGVQRKKAEEYLRLLVDLGYLKTRDLDIVVPETSEASS